MTHQRLSFNPASRTSSIRSLWFVSTLVVSQLLACNGKHNQTNQMTKTDSIATNANPETFQELGFFGDIKKEKWNDFVHAVQNNINHSRKEHGNLSFSLYQPEGGKLQPIWFESFKNKAAHHYHKEQDYFKNAITVIEQSLAGEANAITLRVVEEIPATIPKISNQPAKARYVIVLFDVIPEKRKAFINAMASTASSSRKSPGSLEFNLYRYANDPNKFVLIEGWQSKAEHEIQLKQNHIKKLHADLEGLLVSDPMKTRWLLEDISE